MSDSSRGGGEERLTIACPLGTVEITGIETAVRRVHLAGKKRAGDRFVAAGPVLLECARQLREYFLGERRCFDLPLDMKGTEFEKQVWQELLNVPYGKTASYKEIAGAVGRPAAARAVGAANGKNPIAVIVPCHRVIGHDGRLVGYGGGLWRKKWLLEHEKLHSK